MKEQTLFEVIVIGGSYAGLSAAMTLGRSLRKILVIDSGKPCNLQTPHSHNFLTQDGTPPAEIATLGRRQVAAYETVSFLEDKVVGGERIEDSFSVRTASGKTFTTQKMIFATGIRDILPPIKGFADCWGITAIHCPYCHGFEFRNRKTAIMANGDAAFHLAPLVKNLTEDVTILTSGKARFTAEQLVEFEKNNIVVNTAQVEALEHTKGHLNRIVFDRGETVRFEAMYAAVPFEQHSNVPEEMGCEINEMGYIAVNEFQQTSQDGIYACGDNNTFFRSVANAVAQGNVAGAMVNKELTRGVG